MSIGQKFEKVADAVYEKGKTDIISNSKYIEKQATGKVIRLDDVSEIAHKVRITAETDTEVKVYGKNLFDISSDTRFTRQADGSYINNTSVSASIKTPLLLPYDSYNLSFDLMCPVGINARIRVYLKDGSFVETTKSSTGEFLYFETKIVGEIEEWGLYYSTTPQAGTLLIKNAILNVGTASEPYEPYTKQTITATPEGTEVSSICPNMTIFADNDVTVDYYSSFGMAEADIRWANAITSYGKRNTYIYGFSYANYEGRTIPEELFKATGSIAYLFYQYQGEELPKGINLSSFNADTASLGGTIGMFNGSTPLRKIYDIGLGAVAGYENFVRNCLNLHTIEVIRCAAHSIFTNAFQSDTALTHCIFSGTIASNIDLHWSTLLDRASILSLLQCLNVSVTGVTITLPKMCIDKQTDTLAFIQGDTELNTAYTQALANGYTIAFQ